MYSEKIIQNFTNPKNVGIIKKASGTGSATNDLGELVKFTISVESGIISQCKFKAYGGATLIGACSLMTKHLQNKSIEVMKALSLGNVLEIVGEVSDEDKVSLSTIWQALLLCAKNYNDNYLSQNCLS